MKIAICDEELKQLNWMKTLLEEYAERKGIWMEIVIFQSYSILVQEFSKNSDFDIVLLDACMSNELGIGVAREIRENDESILIIFLAFSGQFALDASRVRAFDYLLKPVKVEELEEKIERAIIHRRSVKHEVMVIKGLNGRVQKINPQFIEYIESNNHEQKIVMCWTEQILAKQTLLQLQQKLQETNKLQFISPYKGYIVNLRCVIAMNAEGMQLKSGNKIPIVKRKYKEIKEQYLEFLIADEM